MDKRPETQLDDIARRFATAEKNTGSQRPKRRHRPNSGWKMMVLLIAGVVLAAVAAGFMIATNGGL